MDNIEPTSLFREEALKNQSSDVNVGEIMIILTSKSWLALLAILVLLFLIFLWSIFGGIPDNISGDGILMSSEYNFILEAVEEGKVEEIFVKEGDAIEEGQTLGFLKNDFIDLAISEACENKNLIETQLKEFKIQHYQLIKAKREAILQNIKSKEAEIQRTESEIAFLLKDIEWLLDLHRQGLVALTQVNQTQLRLNEQKATLESAQVSIQEGFVELKRLEDVREIQNYYSRLEKADQEIKEQLLRKEKLKIISPFKGKVINVPVKSQDFIPKGGLLLWAERIVETDDSKLIYAYFDISKDQRILPGMEAFVKLNDVSYKRYGELVAVVEQVWPFPVSSEQINNIIGNKLVVSSLTKQGAVSPIQVLLKPIKSQKTFSGYLWTSRLGPMTKLKAGTLVTPNIVISVKKPIEFVFPVLRKIRDGINYCRYEKLNQEYQSGRDRPIKKDKT